MKFFLDSALVDEIRYALEMWDIDGITTNPRHVQVSGKPFLRVIQEIGALRLQEAEHVPRDEIHLDVHGRAGRLVREAGDLPFVEPGDA